MPGSDRSRRARYVLTAVAALCIVFLFALVIYAATKG